MWLPLPTAQGYKGQALRVLNKTFFNTLFSFDLDIQLKKLLSKNLDSLTHATTTMAIFFLFKKIMARSVAKQF